MLARYIRDEELFQDRGATQVRDGAEAYFRSVNDKGGVHGRADEFSTPNRYAEKELGYSPARVM